MSKTVSPALVGNFHISAISWRWRRHAWL